MKLEVDLSEKQLTIIKEALNLYSRVLCGQIEEVPKVIKYADFNRTILHSREANTKCEEAVKVLKSILFPEVYPASFSICNTDEKLPKTAAIAYDTLQVINKLLNKNSVSIFKTSIEEELPVIKIQE